MKHTLSFIGGLTPKQVLLLGKHAAEHLSEFQERVENLDLDLCLHPSVHLRFHQPYCLSATPFYYIAL